MAETPADRLSGFINRLRKNPAGSPAPRASSDAASSLSARTRERSGRVDAATTAATANARNGNSPTTGGTRTASTRKPGPIQGPRKPATSPEPGAGRAGPQTGAKARTFAEPGGRGPGNKPAQASKGGRVRYKSTAVASSERPKARPSSGGGSPRVSTSNAPTSSPRPQPRPTQKTQVVEYGGESFTVPAGKKPRSIAEAQRAQRKLRGN
jgi:hypothetical protein